jgi:hypothetical protein
MKGEDLLLIGIGGFLVYKLVSKKGTATTTAEKRQQLITWMNSSAGDTTESKAEFAQIMNTMTDHEIDVTYNWVFNRIAAADAEQIFSNYNIFT